MGNICSRSDKNSIQEVFGALWENKKKTEDLATEGGGKVTSSIEFLDTGQNQTASPVHGSDISHNGSAESAVKQKSPATEDPKDAKSDAEGQKNGGIWGGFLF